MKRVRNLGIALLCLLLWPIQGTAAVIGHGIVEVLTNQTTSSNTFVTCGSASLSSGTFTTGRKYLLFVAAQPWGTTGSGTEMRLEHGGTPFTGSQTWELFIAGTHRQMYGYFNVWTAPGGEGVDLKYRDRLGSGTASCNFASIFWMDLSDLVEGVDYVFNENTTTTGLTATFASFASITFTPTVNNQDWLVLGHASLDYNDQISTYVKARINAGTPVVPDATIDSSNSTLDNYDFPLARVYTLPNSSQTIAMQAATSSGTNGNHQSSRILALRMHAFKDHAFAYTEAAANLSASAYADQLATLSITPSVASDMWLGAYWTFNRANASRQALSRIQVDNSDQPAGQTTAAYQFRQGSDQNPEPLIFSTMVPGMTAAGHTVDLDASADSTTGTPSGRERTLWALSMELAASGGKQKSLRQGVPQ